MKRRFFSILLILVFAFSAFSQPAEYYNNAAGKTGAELKTALYNIIKGHTDLGYDGLYSIYTTSDNLPSGKVWDMYSIKADGTANYWFTHTSGDRCGSYSSESDCYNREHTFCDSWLGKASPQRSDAHHIVPTDGYVNNRRSSFPHGKVGSVSWTSSNGSKLGSSDASTGYSGTVFEPIDEFKGDFARMYFYVATRYEDKIAGWASNGSAGEILAGNTYPAYKTWFKDLMLQWSQQDPVSQKEIDRNNAIYTYQHNRNPYIDHPEYAVAVWSSGPIALNFTSSPITTATINQLYTYSISVTGPVGSTFTITPTAKPSWLTLANGSNGYATLSGTPTAAGSFDVVLSVTDGTSTKSQTFAIQVAALDGLKFTSTPIISATSGISYSYSVTATNASNPSATITLSATTKPAWLTLTSTGNGAATLSGTPTAAGTNSVTLSANDGTTTITQSFTITVVIGGVANTETFTNMPANASNYALRTWVGDNSINWTASSARTDETINSRAICLAQTASTYLLSGIISGGCSQISFKHQQKYSGSGGTITLFINNQQVESPISVNTTEQTALFNGFNYTGDFTIKLVSNGLTRIGIDDLSWVSATVLPNISPVITNISNTPIYPTTNDDVVISANISDSDGTIKEASVKWGLSESNLNNTLPMNLDGTIYKATIPKQVAGTIYLSVNAKDNLDAISSVVYNYIVVQNELPAISNITKEPLSPVTGQAIKITATITDSDGSIEDSWLRWGTSPSNLSNQVTMTLVGGNYEALIPPQTQAGSIYLSINARDDLGAVSTSLYNFSIALANLFPQITNIVNTPQSPLTGQSVKITAIITDSDGSIQEASLKWGISNSSLVNQVSMSLVGGSYEATIPSQAQAGIIYFSINAKDNLDAISTELSNYTVAQNQSPVISNIAKTPQSPLTGQSVKVTASITDSDGTIQEVILSWGTSNSNLVNMVSMSLIGGSYEATIPAQAQSGTIYFSINAKDNLDAISTELSSYTVAQNQSPVISNISNSPQSPLTGQPITISATIADSDGTVQDAWIDWGEASNNLTNKVNMTLTGGSYIGTIPSQSQARTIYLNISAKDNLLATTSVQSSFVITPSTNVNNEENRASIKAYPNPAKNQLNVEIQEMIVSQITISNIIGETLISLPYGGSKQTIDISSLKAGIYFIVATGDGFRKTTRIVVY